MRGRACLGCARAGPVALRCARPWHAVGRVPGNLGAAPRGSRSRRVYGRRENPALRPGLSPAELVAPSGGLLARRHGGKQSEPVGTLINISQ